MIPNQTPRSLMRSFQNSARNDKAPPTNTKDTIKGFIQASRQPPLDYQHQKLVNSPQLQRFNAYIEDQVIRIPPSNTSTPSNGLNKPSSNQLQNNPNEISAFPTVYSASSPPPIPRPILNSNAPPPTPATQLKQEKPSEPSVFSPAANSNAPQNTPATQMKSVMMTPPSSSSQPRFISFQTPSTVVPTPHEVPTSHSQNQSSISHNDDSTYNAISSSSPQPNFTDDASFDKLLSSPALKGMQIRIVDQILQLQSPADKSHASRSFFELSPSPAQQSRQSISKSLDFSSENPLETPEKNGNISAEECSTPSDAHTVRTPQSASNLRPIIIQTAPSNNSKEPRGSSEMPSSEDEKNLVKEKEKSSKLSPRYSPASPITPLKIRRDFTGKRLVNISRIENIEVKGSPKFALIDYCLVFFNLIVFIAILVTLAILCQVMSAVHQSSIEELLMSTVENLANIQIGDIFSAFGQKYLPFF